MWDELSQVMHYETTYTCLISYCEPTEEENSDKIALSNTPWHELGGESNTHLELIKSCLCRRQKDFQVVALITTFLLVWTQASTSVSLMNAVDS